MPCRKIKTYFREILPISKSRIQRNRIDSVWNWSVYFLRIFNSVYESCREIEKSLTTGIRQFLFRYFSLFVGPLWNDRSRGLEGAMSCASEGFRGSSGETEIIYEILRGFLHFGLLIVQKYIKHSSIMKHCNFIENYPLQKIRHALKRAWAETFISEEFLNANAPQATASHR